LHLSQLSQLIRGSPEPELLAVSRNPKVVGAWLGAHRTEQFAGNSFGGGCAILLSRVRGKDDNEQIPGKRSRA
jgi:hypothetical protein